MKGKCAYYIVCVCGQLPAKYLRAYVRSVQLRGWPSVSLYTVLCLRIHTGCLVQWGRHRSSQAPYSSPLGSLAAPSIHPPPSLFAASSCFPFLVRLPVQASPAPQLESARSTSSSAPGLNPSQVSTSKIPQSSSGGLIQIGEPRSS